MEYTFYPPYPFMARRTLKHMKGFTFALPERRITIFLCLLSHTVAKIGIW
jgi:hypothetical protein